MIQRKYRLGVLRFRSFNAHVVHTVQRFLRRKPLWIARLELIDVSLQHILELHIQRIRRLRQIPGHIAELSDKCLAIEVMPLRKMLFHDVDGLTRLAAQAHHAVDEHVLPAELRVERSHGEPLVFVNGHPQTPLSVALS